MTPDPSALKRLSERLAAFDYAPVATRPEDEAMLADVRRAAPPLPEAAPGDPGGGDAAEALRETLAQRAEAIGTPLARCHERRMGELAVEALHAPHAYAVLFAHSAWIDALHRFAFDMALDELPLLLQMRRLEDESELNSRRHALERREERLAALEAQLVDPPDDDPAHLAYLQDVAATQRDELVAARRDMQAREAAVPAYASFTPDPETVRGRVVMFARGGYGRAEMSFSSDVDTGYCLDPRDLPPAHVPVYHELVLRTERYLASAGLETAHQFFELGEDLSRFAEPEALHTIPSILESRALAGNPAVLEALQAQFAEVVPYETLVRSKVEEFDDQAQPNYTSMDLKEDFGGLRSIQIPLWLVGITEHAPSFATADLLRLALEKGQLSPWETARLLLALEFLSALRNFVGYAEAHYYDREARESGFHVQAFVPNRLDDNLARLYLFRSQRFESMDAFDTYRLQRLEDVQTLSRRLLARVLDRTVTQHLETFQVSVHLGDRQIIAIRAPDGGPVTVGTLFRDPAALLSLFVYIAHTDYALSPPLADALAAAVASYEPPGDAVGQARQAQLLGEMMGAPFAHRAVEAMFAIADPLGAGQPALIGRFIPEFDAAIFLLRRFDGQTMPLHQQVLRSLAHGATELQALRRHYPELYELLQPTEVAALRWSLLLQGLGRLEGAPARPAQTAELAADVLARLGFRDPELERGVRLLVEHHQSVAALARTATYMDQALAQYFEIAGRSLANATLLYLVNLAMLRSLGEAAEVDAASLRAMFEEATALLGEMRGFPVKERSLEAINLYFDRKKQDLVADTRLHLLHQQAIAAGLHPVVYEPLRAADPALAERVAKAAPTLDAIRHEIVLGGLNPDELARAEERLLLELRALLGREGVRTLTRDHDALMSWFFASFPNRYLMGALPAELAGQLAKFAHFREASVIVDHVVAPHGAGEGLLIYTRGLDRPHTRVAYAMSRSWVNIGSGKVNRVELGGGDHAYCYYFQISALDPELRIGPREIERIIGSESPPEIQVPGTLPQYERLGVRVEFMGNDHKGYRVVAAGDAFERREADLRHLRLVLRDEPYLIYKVSRAFDLFNVEIQQSLITTVGNQVVDYFYLLPEDYERLRTSRFEEVLIRLVHSDLLAAR